MTARLNVALTLETPDRVADGLGGFQLIWRAEGRLWANLRAVGGDQRLAEVGPSSVASWQITVRAAPMGDARRPRADQRFRLGTRVFRIQSVAESDAVGRYLNCLAKEEGLA